mmetsp:Transcript_43462/g.114207  ORF Transcript_43462/g.114207 Transcript_43462/m.114207 type:complete len:236 (-) Transcript_43462:1730-2437(-)
MLERSDLSLPRGADVGPDGGGGWLDDRSDEAVQLNGQCVQDGQRRRRRCDREENGRVVAQQVDHQSRGRRGGAEDGGGVARGVELDDLAGEGCVRARADGLALRDDLTVLRMRLHRVREHVMLAHAAHGRRRAVGRVDEDGGALRHGGVRAVELLELDSMQRTTARAQLRQQVNVCFRGGPHACAARAPRGWLSERMLHANPKEDAAAAAVEDGRHEKEVGERRAVLAEVVQIRQ